jgi:hypothetical protein
VAVVCWRIDILVVGGIPGMSFSARARRMAGYVCKVISIVYCSLALLLL